MALTSGRLDACNVLLQAAQLLQTFILSHAHLKAQTEELFSSLTLLLRQFDIAQVQNLFHFHCRYLLRFLQFLLLQSRARIFSPCVNYLVVTVALCMFGRATNNVRMGSLCDAKRMASLAISIGTPSISNRILPGFTTATQ